MCFIKAPLLILIMSALLLQGQERADPFTFESRDEIPAPYKWDTSLFYPGWEAWDADLERVEQSYSEVLDYKGRLAEGPEALLSVLELFDRAGMVGGRLWGYIGKVRDVDTRNNEAQAKYRQLLAVYSRVSASLSWFSPELLEIPRETVVGWIDRNPELEVYRFGLMDTYRTGEYVLDENGERLLSLHGKVRGTASDIFSTLTNADGENPEVTLSDGTTVTVTSGLYQKALNSYRNAADRKLVQEAWMRQYEDRRNTFGAIYNGILQKGWALAESRGYAGTLEMELFDDKVPLEVYESLVKSARTGREELVRYHRLRQNLLALDAYGWSDMHVSLIDLDTAYDYEAMVPVIVDSVKPLGDEYHSKIAEQFEAGYVDVFETPGKRSGAYNSGTFGVGSFVLLNYKGTLNDVFTVAHEMGHSMHTRLSHENQPYATHRYTIFVAEVASVMNEKFLLKKLLKEVDDPRKRIAFIETQIEKIHGTFFMQSMMADFELQAHRMAERGEGVTADKLTALWTEVVRAYFGDVIPEEDPYLLSWARIPHLYNSPFYVYQYATCYASAAYLMEELEMHPEETVERYLELLKSGGNDYPMEQLRKAGVDLTREEILQSVVDEFGRLVDLLEQEYTKLLDDGKLAS